MYRIDFNKLRFLVCDDNAHMRRILRTLLHSFGAREVYESEDGATALEMFSHYVPDIVITDWSMPIFDGLELAQMIRQPDANGNPYAPIIMCATINTSPLAASVVTQVTRPAASNFGRKTRPSSTSLGTVGDTADEDTARPRVNHEGQC